MVVAQGGPGGAGLVQNAPGLDLENEKVFLSERRLRNERNN